MSQPIGHFASARSNHADADILERIEDEFGSQLQELTADDKGAVLICLVESATNTHQVFIQENFFTSANGGSCWELAKQLSFRSQLNLAVAIANQLTEEVR
jgi:hypothetical protein